MNQINPIHILVILIVVVFLFFVKLGQVKNELQVAQNSYNETLEMVTKIKGLKTIYSAKEQTKKALQRVLRQPSLSHANIEKKETNYNIVITSRSIDKKALDSLMSKVLNGVYKINLIDIRRVSNEKASLKLEIKW